MKNIYPFLIGVLLISACSTQKFVSFETPKSETFSTDKLKSFLRSTPNPKVVLRVPNAQDNTTEEDGNTYIYNTIEKELLKNQFVVRDRALFNEVIKKSGDKVNYAELKSKTDTDIILELSNLQTDVEYRTNQYYTRKGKKSLFGKGDIVVKGAKVDFKVVLIIDNEYAGNYNFNYTPCLTGCEVYEAKRGPKFRISGKSAKQPYQVVSQRELESFFADATNRLIVALKQ
ncbi:hypothetical protein [Chitinophaga deserti]|uniref:hypothetical protein n=1 Tax=Chitinophaga deserti TaxID=2164099 RepID=UPI000D6B752C|nr:hypothetical protein [Chitinophaga deserti]